MVVAEGSSLYALCTKLMWCITYVKQFSSLEESLLVVDSLMR